MHPTGLRLLRHNQRDRPQESNRPHQTARFDRRNPRQHRPIGEFTYTSPFSEKSISAVFVFEFEDACRLGQNSLGQSERVGRFRYRLSVTSSPLSRAGEVPGSLHQEQFLVLVVIIRV